MQRIPNPPELVAALAAGLVFIGAATPPPAPVATLTPPSGWSRQELFGKFAPGMSGIYYDLSQRSADFVPKIFVMQEPSQSPTLRDSVHEALKSFTDTGYRIRVNRSQTVCSGRRAGWFIAYTKPSTEPLIVEQTRFVDDTMVYTATYVRLSKQREDRSAREALDTLCLKRAIDDGHAGAHNEEESVKTTL